MVLSSIRTPWNPKTIRYKYFSIQDFQQYTNNATFDIYYGSTPDSLLLNSVSKRNIKVRLRARAFLVLPSHKRIRVRFLLLGPWFSGLSLVGVRVPAFRFGFWGRACGSQFSQGSPPAELAQLISHRLNSPGTQLAPDWTRPAELVRLNSHGTELARLISPG